MALHLDADARDGQPLRFQMHLQGGHKLPKLGRHRIGADQQAPLSFIDRSSLDSGTQRRRKQWSNGRQTAAGGAHPVDQTSQCRRFLCGLMQRNGVMAALCFSHDFFIIPHALGP